MTPAPQPRSLRDRARLKCLQDSGASVAAAMVRIGPINKLSAALQAASDAGSWLSSVSISASHQRDSTRYAWHRPVSGASSSASFQCCVVCLAFASGRNNVTEAAVECRSFVKSGERLLGKLVAGEQLLVSRFR
jgi:hypothetical protein